MEGYAGLPETSSFTLRESKRNTPYTALREQKNNANNAPRDLRELTEQ
jgi:hypothetical protein